MFEQNIVSFTGEHHANYRNWGSLQLGHKPLNYKKVLKWSQWAACPFSLRWTVFSCCFMDYCLFFFTKTRGVRGFYTSYAAGTQWNFILIHGNNNHARWESFNQCSTALFTSFFPPFWSYWKEKPSPVGTSALRLNHPALFICKLNSSGMQGTRSKALWSWRSIQNMTLSKSFKILKTALPPCLKRLGPDL